MVLVRIFISTSGVLDPGIGTSICITARMVAFSLLETSRLYWILNTVLQYFWLSLHMHQMKRVWIGGKQTSSSSLRHLCTLHQPRVFLAFPSAPLLLLLLPHSFPSVNYSYHKQRKHLCNLKRHLVRLQMPSVWSAVFFVRADPDAPHRFVWWIWSAHCSVLMLLSVHAAQCSCVRTSSVWTLIPYRMKSSWHHGSLVGCPDWD